MGIFNNELGDAVQNIVDIVLEDLRTTGLIEQQDVYRQPNVLSLAALIDIYDCLADIEEIAQEEGEEAGYDEGYSEGYSEGFAEGFEEAQKNQSVK